MTKWPDQMGKFIANSVIEALSIASFKDELAAAVHRSEYVKQINDAMRSDPDMVRKLMKGFQNWDNQNDQSRLLMTSLFKVAKQFDQNRETLFRFCMEKYPDEPHQEVQIGLIFGAFHCSTLEEEKELCMVIDWVKENLEQFDKVCSGFYGTPEECLKDMEERLLSDSNFSRAAPLYFFNLRAEVGMIDKVRTLIEPYLKNERSSCHRAAEIVLTLDQV